MQLQFLGQSYNANTSTIETSESGMTARFLGQTYQPHRAIFSQNPGQVKRTYRGVSY